MNKSSARDVLNSLIETCKDAERGMLHAAELVKTQVLKDFFTDTAYQRAQFAEQLLPHAQRLGGAAAADGTTGAALHRKWMDFRDTISGHDEHAVVSEAERGDSLTVEAFKGAVDGALPATVRDLVERGYKEVKQSHLRFADLNEAAR